MVTIVRPDRSDRTIPIVIIAGSVITSIVIGVRLTFGLYLEPVIEALGTDRGTYAFAIAVQNLMWGLSQPIAGAIADRYGSARVLVAGAVGYMAAMLILASSTTTTLLLASAGFGVGIATGAASFAVVLSAVGRLVPPTRRSMALGIVTAMGSVGQFVLVPLAQRLLEAAGWRQTVTVFAFVILSAAVFAAPFRGRAADHLATAGDDTARSESSLRAELRRAASHPSYLMLNAAFFVCGFHVTFIGTHLPSYVTDLGIDAGVAATALALVGLFNIAGSLTAGVLGGRFAKTKLLSIIYFSRAIVIATYVLLPTTATTTILFGASFGLLWLSTVPLTSGIVTSQFGTRHSGTLFGIVFLSHQLGAFSGVWAGGELADATGSYRTAWLIAIALGGFAALLHLIIDEGPAPDAPVPARGRPRLAAAGAVTILAGGASMLAVGARADAEPVAAPPTATAHPASPSPPLASPPLVCPLVAPSP